MEKNGSGGITGQSRLDDLAGVDTRPVDGAVEQFRVLDDPVLIIQEEAGKNLMLILGHLQADCLAGRSGRSECRPAPELQSHSPLGFGNDDCGIGGHILAEEVFDIQGRVGIVRHDKSPVVDYEGTSLSQ